VFSNAAMHWMLRREETRESLFLGARNALKPGGVFVFEMGVWGTLLRYENFCLKFDILEERTNLASPGANCTPQRSRKTSRIRESKGGKPLVLPR
jgi:hypothetical protein